MTGNSLSHILNEQFAELLVSQAETIRAWPDVRERTEQAETHVRTALLEQMRGRISQESQFRIYSILSFVMPEDGAFEREMKPLAELEREADWETAYHEQLRRQSCPECGDWACSAPHQLRQ